MENDNSLINRSASKCRSRQPKAKGHHQQACTDAAEGVIKEYEDFPFLQQDHIFKGELMECMELMNRSETDGMQTFDQDLFKLYTDGRITVDEALRQAESVNDLRLKIELWDKGNDKEAIYDRVSNLSLQK